MKKLFILTTFVFSMFACVGCGSGDGTVVEPVDQNEGGMSDSEQAEYEKMMKEGSSPN